MPKQKTDDLEFNIYIDPSDQRQTMDNIEVKKRNEVPFDQQTESSVYESSSEEESETEREDHVHHRQSSVSGSRRQSQASCSSCDGTEDGGYRSHSRAPSAQHSVYSERTADEGAESSSSHHEGKDDVFSDHSPRSSMGSVSENDHRKPHDAMSNVTTRSRLSHLSRYEEEEEDFVPTIRGTPRPPFRSPSEVKAMQMNSPASSVVGSSRSSRRTPLPTVSRIGSPSVSAQYSPKRAPPRFKRETPPLVLLHVTLLPLRWTWGEVVNNAKSHQLTREGKTTKDAWNQLQDRMGDTTIERGILLPHPQSDYEILEERLLEALELPMRRRARILECGHYLGPSNEFSLMDESTSDDEDFGYDDDDDASSHHKSADKKTHWCITCRSEIRYDSLGPGKIFRVKIYASNGLMKGGAWEACWKEMERVDVELEPIVEPAVQEEFEKLASEQAKALELHTGLKEPEKKQKEENEETYEDEPTQLHHGEESFTERAGPETTDAKTDARSHETHSHKGAEHDFRSHAQGSSPGAQNQEAYKNASLPQLIAQSTRVILQDKKNIIIMLLSVLVVMIAVRGNLQAMQDSRMFHSVMTAPDMATTTVQAHIQEEVVATISPVAEIEGDVPEEVIVSQDMEDVKGEGMEEKEIVINVSEANTVAVDDADQAEVVSVETSETQAKTEGQTSEASEPVPVDDANYVTQKADTDTDIGSFESSSSEPAVAEEQDGHVKPQEEERQEQEQQVEHEEGLEEIPEANQESQEEANVEVEVEMDQANQEETETDQEIQEQEIHATDVEEVEDQEDELKATTVEEAVFVTLSTGYVLRETETVTVTTTIRELATDAAELETKEDGEDGEAGEEDVSREDTLDVDAEADAEAIEEDTLDVEVTAAAEAVEENMNLESEDTLDVEVTAAAEAVEEDTLDVEVKAAAEAVEENMNLESEDTQVVLGEEPEHFQDQEQEQLSELNVDQDAVIGDDAEDEADATEVVISAEPEETRTLEHLSELEAEQDAEMEDKDGLDMQMDMQMDNDDALLEDEDTFLEDEDAFVDFEGEL